jgi:hypothetical protein
LVEKKSRVGALSKAHQNALIWWGIFASAVMRSQNPWLVSYAADAVFLSNKLDFVGLGKGSDPRFLLNQGVSDLALRVFTLTFQDKFVGTKIQTFQDKFFGTKINFIPRPLHSLHCKLLKM